MFVCEHKKRVKNYIKVEFVQIVQLSKLQKQQKRNAFY